MRVDGNSTNYDPSTASGGESNSACKLILFVLVVLFVLGVIVFSFLSFNYQNMQKSNFPANSKGHTCNIDFGLSYPYLYIDLSSHNPTYRCVHACPSGWNQFIITDSEGEEIYAQGVEEPKLAFGGICWSEDKEAALREKGFLEELSFKSSILDQFRSILINIAFAFLLSSIGWILFYCLPQIVNYLGSIIAAFLLLAAAIVFSLGTNFSQTSLLIILVITAFTFVVTAVCWIQKLKESVIYVTATLETIQSGQTESILLKSTLILLIFNIIDFVFLMLVLLQLVAIVSSEGLQREDYRLFYIVQKTWWKYVLLFIEWFVVSNILKELYSLVLVKFGCQLLKKEKAEKLCFSFSDLLNIVELSLISTFLWIPLRIMDLFKPNGAIIRMNQEETWRHKCTKAAYCCCGSLINKLHRYTFTPYLVLALGKKFQDLEGSLRIVQETYHSHDDSYDRSSLWVYRLSCYICTIISSILCMYLVSSKKLVLSSGDMLLFYLINAVLAVDVSRLNINFWSGLVQVKEFITIA